MDEGWKNGNQRQEAHKDGQEEHDKDLNGMWEGVAWVVMVIAK